MRLYNGVRIVDRPAPNNVHRLDMGVLPVANEMMATGMRLDTGHLLKLKEKWLKEMQVINEGVNEMTGFPCDLSSPDQVAKLLFKDLGIKTRHKIKLTDSGKREQVDSDVLELIRDAHECIPPIIDHRRKDKLQSTYTTSLIRLVNPHTRRLHTDILTTRASTHRWASKYPNLQNIPIRTKEGSEIRKAFIPSPGNLIGSNDLSQIELRCMASERNVKRMIEIFLNKGDLHTETAIELFKLDRQTIYAADKLSQDHGKNCPCVSCKSYAEFRWQQRMPTKNVNFGIVYLITAKGLATLVAVSGGDQSFWTEKQCERTIQDWYGIYPEVLEGSKLQNRRARQTGFVWDPFGAVSPVPEIKSVHPWVVSEGLRRIGNMHIQSYAAGILKLAMTKIYHEWKRYWHKFGVKLLMAVHDELLSEGPKDVLPDFLYYAADVMENIVTLKNGVPIESGIAYSEESWGHLAK